VFIDSSVIVAGLAATDASREILKLAEFKVIHACISEQVVMEVFDKVGKVLPTANSKYFVLFRTIPFLFIEQKEESAIIAKKRCNDGYSAILDAALESKCHWFLTLDAYLLSLSEKNELPFTIAKPEQFIAKSAFLPRD
jgi:predicted nucleic acid-binding protein